ncbi:MAG: hypothetical protein D6756_01425 [Cyanobacteria bacterium J083]|nr:MAG: hypothetical protein D6756_01425 [Cyanobacteria bacterium J083]
MSQATRLLLWFFASILACLVVFKFPLLSDSSLSAVNNQAIIQQLSSADIVYLGERHNVQEDHAAQLEIIASLYKQEQNLAIALEMFQRPYQIWLDKYLNKQITEEELKQKTEYEQRWGFNWEYYAPILRFAQAHRIPLLALNTPSEITRKVAKTGLDSLSRQEASLIPPKSEIKTDNADYRAMLQEIYQAHSQGAHGNSDNFENFFTAQVLWDETMAETIANYRQSNPDRQIIVLTGVGHIIYGYGIPSRVARRLSGDIVQKTVIFQEDIPKKSTNKAPADYFWQHHPNLE